MRQKQNVQLPLAVPASKHPRAQLLEKISRIIDENPTFNELVWQDLTAGKMDHGNHGLTAEQVLRCAVLKQLEQLCYDELLFLLNETPLYQSFCRIGIGGRIPSRSSVAEGIKAVSSETWEKINVSLVQYAASEGVEKGREVRGDCTVVESNIPKPFDSVLLYDSIRVITRILKQIGFSGYHDRTRSAKRRVNEIRNCRGERKRRGRYEALMRITGEVIGYARSAIEEIVANRLECPSDTACRLSRHIGMAEGVMDQAYRRMVLGESVPASEKIISIFEPHADIIRKDRRDTYYGHKVYLTGGKSNLVLDCMILAGHHGHHPSTEDSHPTRTLMKSKNLV